LLRWRFTEWSRGDASAIDGQAFGPNEHARESQTHYNNCID
jgi:hypothetical protein